MKCGNARSLEGPDGPAPGSYYSILGYQTMDAFKFVGAFVLLFLAVELVPWLGLSWKRETIVVATVLTLFLALRKPLLNLIGRARVRLRHPKR